MYIQVANSDPNLQFGWIMNGKMVRSFTLKTAENGTFSPILLILVNTNASIFRWECAGQCAENAFILLYVSEHQQYLLNQ